MTTPTFKYISVTAGPVAEYGPITGTAVGGCLVNVDDYPVLLAELAEVMLRWDYQNMATLEEVG